MKSILAKAGMVGILASSSMMAHAISYSDLDTWGNGARLDANPLTTQIPSLLRGSFNIVNDDPDDITDSVGFREDTDLMHTAAAWFTFHNTNTQEPSTERVHLVLEDIVNADSQGRTKPIMGEFSLFDGAAKVQAYVTLNTHGFYLYALKAISGDFFLDSAQFNGDARRLGSVNVPDAGSTFGMFGAAFLGLHFVSRRLRKA